jgi:ABC-type multidrug transport system ATPase subunit
LSARVRIEGVTIDRVVKTFGPTAALRGVTARIAGGGLTLIEGANGSGKTTLLRVLGTILPPTSGRVRYPPVGEDRIAIRREIGWLSHEPLAYGDLSGQANIALAAQLHGLEVDRVWERTRERFELGRFAERPLRTNSRGQRQRVALARALVHEPSLVLLDEPTTGLDRSGVERLLQVVAGEVARGALVVVVSHDPALFDDFSPRRIVLDRGKVVDVVDPVTKS